MSWKEWTLLWTLMWKDIAAEYGTLDTPNNGCHRVNASAVLVCTVRDESHFDGTDWSGTVFNCPSTNSISNNSIYLLHELFNGGTQGSCNGGTVRAESTAVNGSMYTSTLTIMPITLEMNGQSVICSLAGVTAVAIELLRVGVDPDPPSAIHVNFSVAFETFTVTWTKPLNVIGGIGGFLVNTSGDCGQCTNIGVVESNVTQVSCSGWEPLGQTCNISVYTITEDCQFMSEEPALAVVHLKTPQLPRIDQTVATYDTTGSLKFITTALLVGNQITTDENGLQISYTVLYTHSSLGEITEIILDCPRTNNCTHVFTADQTNGEYTATVGAKTAVGKVVQPENTRVTVGASNTFVHVTIHVLQSYTIVNCFSFTTYNHFSCQIEYGLNCDTLNSRKERSIVNDSDAILILRDILPVTHYCFVLTADNQSYRVNVEGTFSGYSYTRQPPTMTNAVTGHGSSTFVITTSIISGVAVIMSLVALIALVALVLVCLKNRKPTSRSTEPTSTVYYSTIGERDRPRAEGTQPADPTYEEVTAVKVPEISTDPNDAYHPVRTVETNEAYQISIRNVH